MSSFRFRFVSCSIISKEENLVRTNHKERPKGLTFRKRFSEPLNINQCHHEVDRLDVAFFGNHFDKGEKVR